MSYRFNNRSKGAVQYYQKTYMYTRIQGMYVYNVEKYLGKEGFK